MLLSTRLTTQQDSSGRRTIVRSLESRGLSSAVVIRLPERLPGAVLQPFLLSLPCDAASEARRSRTLFVSKATSRQTKDLAECSAHANGGRNRGARQSSLANQVERPRRGCAAICVVTQPLDASASSGGSNPAAAAGVGVSPGKNKTKHFNGARDSAACGQPNRSDLCVCLSCSPVNMARLDARPNRPNARICYCESSVCIHLRYLRLASPA